MDFIICSCVKCSSVIGTFENAFIKIGKVHYCPVYSNSGLSKGLAVSGEVREAAADTTIENSSLQDLVCRQCDEILGIHCVSAPSGHILRSGQSILRLGGAGGLRAVSEATGKKATLIVQKSYSLQKGSGKTKEIQTDRGSSIPIDPALLQQDVAKAVNNNPANGNQDDNRLQELDNFADWAADAIRGQKKDIDRISGVVSKIENDMRSLKDLMITIRKDLGVKQNSSEVTRVSKDVVYLQNDVDNLRLEVQNISTPRDQDETRALAEDVNLMTDSLSLLSNKVNEVETLKMEIQFMKNRLKRLEDGTRAASQAPELRASATPESLRRPGLIRAASSVPSFNRGPQRKATESFSPLARASVGPQVAPHKRKSFPGSDAPSIFKRGRLSSVSINDTNHRPSQLSQVHLADEIEDEPPANDLSGLTYVDDDSGDEDYTDGPERAASRKPPQRANTVTLRSSPDVEGTPKRGKRGPPRGRPPIINSEGVKVTKAGLPDRRVGNIKNIRKWQDKMKQIEDHSEIEVPDIVLPSVERDVNGVQPRLQEESVEEKRAALEARERLVRETIERELR